MRIYLPSAILACLLLFYACTHEPTSPNGTGSIPTVSTICSSDTVYFVNEIMPIIASNCAMSGCHDAVTRASGVNLSSYLKIMNYVRAGSATRSDLYKVIIETNPGDRMPPPPRSPLTAAQIAKIQKWINQGARNNSCTSGCDSTQFTYAAVIKPMMDNKCAGCHKAGSLGGNVDLSTYAGTRVVALNGKLVGSIMHQTGYSPMPKNMAKLSDCEITQVRKWVTAGSLNN
ncbi:MAG: hypothetical protein EB025_05390 [Chitinophagaceae bacterium]|jgi:Planctomycete cytochrome C|nr:hypothetical protein [Chitinophagaceae bacterium]NDB53496.1 hypothetical protein [Chitinophagaceae bacterium]